MTQDRDVTREVVVAVVVLVAISPVLAVLAGAAWRVFRGVAW